MYSIHIADRFFENGKSYDQEVLSAVTLDVAIKKLNNFKIQHPEFNHHYFYFTSNNDHRFFGEKLSLEEVEKLI